MDSLRRRLGESIWASKKHRGPVVIFGATSIIKDGDEREGTIVLLFAPFAMRPGCEEKRVVGVMGYTLVSSIYE